MAPLRALAAVATLLCCSGCGYFHFGRQPAAAAPTGDAALAAAYTDLRIEHKILQQELALARREGDTLRAALDKGSAGSDLAVRLQETTRDLTALRAAYAKLQSDRGAPYAASSSAAAMSRAELEEKLAATLRDFTQLQAENTRLRTDVTRVREENTALAARLKAAAAQNEQTQAALAQLNTELLAQKESRARAEQQADFSAAALAKAEAARALLAAVVASGAAKPSLAGARESSAASAVTFGPGGASAELRTSPERLKGAPSSATPAPAPRTHVVRPNETLEMLATKYYGTAEKWVRIYSANHDLLSGGRPLKAGMELVIPED